MGGGEGEKVEREMGMSGDNISIRLGRKKQKQWTSLVRIEEKAAGEVARSGVEMTIMRVSSFVNVKVNFM